MPSIQSRIESLQPRILATAKRIYASQPISDLVEVDDIHQEIAVRILERAAVLPNLAEQTDAYLMIDASRNGGMRSCVKATIYRKYVGEEITLGTSDEDDEDYSIMTITPDGSESVESQVIYREMFSILMNRIQTLSPESREVIELSMNGMTDSEISRELGIDRSAVTHRRKTITKHLSAFIQ
jgi:RNA polymerase sigma factor (sigma-70 family)